MCIQDIQFSNLYSLETVSALSHSVDIVIFLEQKKLNDLQSIYDNKVKITSSVTNSYLEK